MKKNFKHHIITLLSMFAITIATILSSSDASAIESALTVSPMEQKLTVYSGETSMGSVRVSNNASATETLYYTVSAVPFTRTGDAYEPIVGEKLSDGGYNDIVNWVTFSSTSGSLNPNETDEIIYTINVPKDARGGGQYFAILVTRTKSPSDGTKQDNGVSLDAIIQIASTVYVSVSGEDVQLAGTIKDNHVSSFLLHPPVETSFTIENTGNTHLEVKYYVQIFPLFSDEEIYTNEEDPSIATVLPESSRHVIKSWEDSPKIGIYKVKQTIEMADATSTQEKIVFICPVWLLITIILAIITIVAWLYSKSKKRKSSKK